MGTIADKLAYLGQTKAEIRDAIVAKGVEVSAETAFREYADRIKEITGGASGSDDWKRPADWLKIEGRVKTGDQKFVGLHAIFEDSNFVSLSATGNYTVDWGDGKTENFASGVQASHVYTYSSFAGTETTNGYRQAIVTVTPQSGQNLTNINLQRKHAQTGLNAYSTGWLDIQMSAPNMTTLVIGGTVTPHRLLEGFTFLGTNLITDYRRLFQGCTQLQFVPLFDTSRGTNFGSMFTSCSALKKIPSFVTTKGSDFSYMFESCSSLKTIPLLDTAGGTSFSGMFFGCQALQTVPLLETGKGDDFSMMFSFCASLKTVPLFNLSSGTAFTSMFESCMQLKSVPFFETSNGVDFSYMFQECPALQTVPLFKTSSGTGFGNMFFGCTSLQTVPGFDTSRGTAFDGMFTNCSALSKAVLSGTKNTISYGGCKLSRTALVDIFKNLATGVTSKNIVITSNWGASSLTAGDRANATSKGWTIVG